MHKKFHAKKAITLSVILLVSIVFLALPTPYVSAQVSINELSKNEGFVGDSVELTGHINTTNGAYEILFDETPIRTGNATATAVEATFFVPNSTQGTHVVTLRDVEANITSSVSNFNVKTQYIIKATTARFQEGENTTILAITTGGEANHTASANITVTDPDNKTHLCPNFNITTGVDGYGEINRLYPTDFDATPHTFYIGTYNLTLKIGENTTQGSFYVGLTDASQYHRFQIVNIKAVNYTLPTDMMQVKMIYNEETVFTSPTINASQSGGVVTANWTIPANASIGLYTVNVTRTTPSGTNKSVSDTQIFTIATKNFTCEVKTFNLDNKPVQGVLVEANNTVTVVKSSTTNNEGVASFLLEAANYTFGAFWNGSRVGVISETSLSGNLTGTLALTVNCSLVDIRIATKDLENNMIPFATITTTFTHTVRTGTRVSRIFSTETNLTGIAVFHNFFVNINYTVRASRYDHSLSTITINVTATSWLNITFPTHKLTVNVYDKNGTALQNSRVKVYEWSVGANALDYLYVRQETTDENGNVSFSFTFGKYGILVYINDILANQTSVILNQSKTLNVHCMLYPLTLDVRVADYFGQGLQNANVTIEREDVVVGFSATGGSGDAHFAGLVGGDYKILICIAQKPYTATTFGLQESKTVNLKIGELVTLGGYLIETTYLTTIILISLIIVVFFLALAFRRLKSRPEKE